MGKTKQGGWATNFHPFEKKPAFVKQQAGPKLRTEAPLTSHADLAHITNQMMGLVSQRLTRPLQLQPHTPCSASPMSHAPSQNYQPHLVPTEKLRDSTQTRHMCQTTPDEVSTSKPIHPGSDPTVSYKCFTLEIILSNMVCNPVSPTSTLHPLFAFRGKEHKGSSFLGFDREGHMDLN